MTSDDTFIFICLRAEFDGCHQCHQVKICMWWHANPITTGLSGVVISVISVISVFLYIYGFFGERADGGRADFELTPCSQTLMTTPACPRIMGATKPLPKILTCANWGYIWGYVEAWENKTVNKQHIKSPVCVSPSHQSFYIFHDVICRLVQMWCKSHHRAFFFLAV